MCAQKLTTSQLSLVHGTKKNRKIVLKIGNENISMAER